MNKNIDQLFKEKFENHEIQPKPGSKEIFLKKAAIKKSRLTHKIAAISAAAVFLLLTGTYFLLNTLNDTSSNATFDVKQNEKITDSGTGLSTDDIHDDKNKSSEHYSIAEKSRMKQIYSAQKNDEELKEYSSLDLHTNDIHISDELSIQSLEKLAANEPEIEIRVTGLSEQILHYAVTESNQKQAQLALQVLNQKIIVQSPVIDEVDQVYHQLKKGIKDFNLADAGRSITNQLTERISSRKNQNQNNH